MDMSCRAPGIVAESWAGLLTPTHYAGTMGVPTRSLTPRGVLETRPASKARFHAALKCMLRATPTKSPKTSLYFAKTVNRRPPATTA